MDSKDSVDNTVFVAKIADIHMKNDCEIFDDF